MLSLLDLCARIDDGRLTPEGAVRLVRAAIAAREPEVGALVCVDPAPVVAAAGPIAGIAVGIKDIIDTPTCRPDGLGDLRELGIRAPTPRWWRG